MENGNNSTDVWGEGGGANQPANVSRVMSSLGSKFKYLSFIFLFCICGCVGSSFVHVSTLFSEAGRGSLFPLDLELQRL